MPGQSLLLQAQQCQIPISKNAKKRLTPPLPVTCNEDERSDESLTHEHSSPAQKTGIRQCFVPIGCFSPSFFSHTVQLLVEQICLTRLVLTNQVRRQGTISSASHLLRPYPQFHPSLLLVLWKKYRKQVLWWREIF